MLNMVGKGGAAQADELEVHGREPRRVVITLDGKI
jgi:hypothetical protein